MTSQLRLTLFYLCCAFAIVPLVQALSITSVSVSPENATTTATLSCLVEASGTGTLTANITWFRNGAAHITDNEQISLTTDVQGSTTLSGNIEAADTTKSETWRCQATVGNTTTSTSNNSSAITIQNTAPVVTFPIGHINATEDTTYNETATANDADGDAIVTWISSDLNSSLYDGASLFSIGGGGAITFSPAQTLVGNHTMALLAFDGESFGGSSVLFTVIEVNDPPVFAILPTDRNATVAENFTITLTGSDEESDPFSFSMQTTNLNLVINNTSSTTAEITFIGGAPIAADIGVIEVNVSAYEVSNASFNSTVTFYINVSTPNSNPEIAPIDNQSSSQGSILTLYINATDNDTTDVLIFNSTSNCSLSNPWSMTTLNNTSTNGSALINLTLTNDHVVCQWLTINVYDVSGVTLLGGSDSQLVFMNITNVNDPPELSNISYNESNSQLQTDLRDLFAGTDSTFTYVVNATDPDNLTYEGDSLTYSDNSSLFAINSINGTISFTPNSSLIGNHLVQITVTDIDGLNRNATLNLTIVSNLPPQISSPGEIICQEDTECAYLVDATDNDTAENLTFISNTSRAVFTQVTYNISETNQTFTNDDVGNHTILLTVSDQYELTNQTTYSLYINNTNDQPFFDNNLDEAADTITITAQVIAGIQQNWIVNITDVDFAVAGENLTFSVNITNGTNASLFSIVKTGANQALIQFTPTSSDTGNYTFNLTVSDNSSAYDQQQINFAIVNASTPPIITGAQPFTNGTVQTNSTITPIYNITTETNVSFSENTTVNFSLSYTDNDTVAGNITIYWYNNGSLITSQSGSTTNLSYYLNFFSEGINNITVIVQDNLLSSDQFTWLVNVSNVNRAPILVSNFSNRTINSTTTLGGEMENFIDPDDDLDSDNFLDSNETNTLIYTMSAATAFTADFSGTDVTITPSAAGIETVTYTAEDEDGLTVTSNSPTYTVVYNPPETSSSSSSGGGGGGGGASSSSVITRKVETPKPYALDILTPKPVTIYENETVVAPLAITNTGTVLLKTITLKAKSEQNITMQFLDDSIVELAVNQTYNTSLIVEGFRFGGTYEIFVTATVADPAFNDSAVFYINSIEKSSEGQNEVNTKITYARDLLLDSPECGELVQLVDQAAVAYRNGNAVEGEKLLAAVSEGCTYLKAQAAKEVAEPSILSQLAGYRYTNFVLGGLLVVMLIIGGLLVAHYAKKE